jgi:hypothetical protein
MKGLFLSVVGVYIVEKKLYSYHNSGLYPLPCVLFENKKTG